MTVAEFPTWTSKCDKPIKEYLPIKKVVWEFFESNHDLVKVDFTTYTLTPNTALIHTSFTYSKLNIDDFSVLTGFLGYLDSTQEVELKSLHVQTWSFLLLNFVIWGKTPPFMK